MSSVATGSVQHFCALVKEQIVDERHATGLYGHLQGVLDEFAAGSKKVTGEEHQLMKALIDKIGADENSHLKILEVIDSLVCHE